MSYEKIAPMGPRLGIGTCDTFCDSNKYQSIDQAIMMDDCVIVDFMKEASSKDIYVEIYHTKKPKERNMMKIDGKYLMAFRKVHPADVKQIEWICNELFNFFRRYGSGPDLQSIVN